MTRSPFILGAIAALTLSACTDPATLGGAGERSNTATGVGIGALVGGAIGALTADNTGKGAAIGAVVGAAAGGAIGYQLDQQAAEMRATLDDDIQVRRENDRLVVTLPQDITFDTDSSYVRPSLQTELNKVAASLVKYPQSNVQVIGHTDNEGDAAYNYGLSQRRAQSVSSILQDGGVGAGRIVTAGRGEDQPIASNLTPEGRAQNRRVEIIVVPTAQG